MISDQSCNMIDNKPNQPTNPTSNSKHQIAIHKIQKSKSLNQNVQLIAPLFDLVGVHIVLPGKLADVCSPRMAARAMFFPRRVELWLEWALRCRGRPLVDGPRINAQALFASYGELCMPPLYNVRNCGEYSDFNHLCQQVNTSVSGRRFVLVWMSLPEYITAA